MVVVVVVVEVMVVVMVGSLTARRILGLDGEDSRSYCI